LTAIDPLLLAGMFAALAWAFGWRVMCIAFVFWGTNPPAYWEWVGGAILRYDWLAACVVGICCLRRERPVAAGLLLAWAVGVRIFPIAVVAGVALAALLRLLRLLRERSLVPTPAQQRFAAAFAGGIAAIVLASSASVGHASWLEFVDNSRTHLATENLRVTGLRPLLSYREQARAALTLDPRANDVYARWRSERQATFAARRPFFVVLAGLYLALLVVALRRQPDWVAGVLGIGMLPVLLGLTSYYYGVLLAFACLWPQRPELGVALLLLATSWWTGIWPGQDLDRETARTSFAILLLVVFVTLRLAQRPWRSPSGHGIPGPGHAEAGR